MNIDVFWISYKVGTPAREYWDEGMLEAIFKNEIWDAGQDIQFTHYDKEYPQTDGAILIIPARYHADYVGRINMHISTMKWCLIILVGDEEAVFPCEELRHPNMKIWVMTPHPGKHPNADRFLINGWHPEARRYLNLLYKQRSLDWFFAGQVTHKRRQDCAAALRAMPNGMLYESPGFTKGLPVPDYFSHLSDAKIAPCPAGAVIPDTFRLWEALEAGCLPIVDAISPKIKQPGYWNYLLGMDTLPFPTIVDWADLPGTVQYFIDTYPLAANRAFAWWQGYKRQMVFNLYDDLKTLIPEYPAQLSKITVLIPTSPIGIHPSTEIIDVTIKSIRDRLPNAEVIIMIDGVREQQKHRMADYNEYIQRLLWKCNYEWRNVMPLLFTEHSHQVAMTREALKYVKTTTILFVEHDTPLCEDIPFDNMVAMIEEGTANMIRLHHEALILPDHRHLMLDLTPQIVNGILVMRTAQWSQRPHLANTEFYKRMLEACFTSSARSMIEDGVHGRVAEAYRSRGKVGWNDWKVWIYAPEGDMKRSYNLDGRRQDPKYDDEFIY